MSPMSPLFCATDVPFESFGEHMQEYTMAQHISTHSQHTLVGGMKARKILSWYIDNVLKVTHMYQSIEYEPVTCFQEFVK